MPDPAGAKVWGVRVRGPPIYIDLLIYSCDPTVLGRHYTLKHGKENNFLPMFIQVFSGSRSHWSSFWSSSSSVLRM